MPLVSVILPTYNRADTLGTAMRSVLDQTHGNLELIVVDDASYDNTPALVAALDDGRVRYVRLSENSGPSRARNVGIGHAQGEYIAFQDSDDEWHPRKLEHQLSLFRTHEYVDIVVCSMARQTAHGVQVFPQPSRLPDGGSIRAPLLCGNFIGLPTLVCRREVFSRGHLFDESLRALEDWDLLLRLSAHTRFGFLDRTLVLSRETKGSVNDVSPRVQSALCEIALRHSEYRSPGLPHARMYYLQGQVKMYLGQVEDARRSFFAAIKAAPRDLRHQFAFAASLLGPAVYRWATRNAKSLRFALSSIQLRRQLGEDGTWLLDRLRRS